MCYLQSSFLFLWWSHLKSSLTIILKTNILLLTMITLSKRYNYLLGEKAGNGLLCGDFCERLWEAPSQRGSTASISWRIEATSTSVSFLRRPLDLAVGNLSEKDIQGPLLIQVVWTIVVLQSLILIVSVSPLLQVIAWC